MTKQYKNLNNVIGNIENEAPPVGGSKWFAHLPIRGGGSVEFDAEFKFAKIQNSHLCVCVVGGVFFKEFDAEFKFPKIQNSHLWGGGRGSRNLMLSSNLLKSKIPMGGFREFDAEFKLAKIQNSHLWGGGSQNLMLSSNLLKSKIPIWGGGLWNLMLSSDLLKSKIPICGGGGGLVEPISNF